jgi:hypothetical protein
MGNPQELPTELPQTPEQQTTLTPPFMPPFDAGSFSQRDASFKKDTEASDILKSKEIR